MNSNGYIKLGCLHPLIVYKNMIPPYINTYCGKRIPASQRVKNTESIGQRPMCPECDTKAKSQITLLPWQVKEYFYE